jgi:guanine nucleotide-binding protein subunit alpha
MAHIMVEQEVGANDPLPKDFLDPIKALWRDGGVKKAIDKGNEYALHDNLAYFCDDIDRLWSDGYVPTDQDLLRSRLRTTGITETVFDLGQLTYRMFDVAASDQNARSGSTASRMSTACSSSWRSVDTTSVWWRTRTGIK